MVLSHKVGIQNGNARRFQATSSTTRSTHNADHISHSQQTTQLWNLRHGTVAVVLSVHKGCPAKERQ